MSSTGLPDSDARIAGLRRAYINACELELRALKPGNVHRHGDGHRMNVRDFERSAEVSAAPLTAPGTSVGARIHAAIAATRAAVGFNTNLGIVLLAAPILAAAESMPSGNLREALTATLKNLTVEDTVATYDAIRLASPAGLGQASAQDVNAPPTIDLRQAMILASDRDRIARQYATGYEDVFGIGVSSLVALRREGVAPEWATSLTFMRFLAAFPDSHVERKYGHATADMIRCEAGAVLDTLSLRGANEKDIASLLAFDQRLKNAALNPGTSADLTVASLLVVGCEISS